MNASQSRQAVAAKVRARYGRFFTYEQYAELASATGMGELVAMLREHPDYAPVFAGRQEEREHTLSRLRYSFYEDLASLFRFDLFLGSELYRVVSEYLTVDLILSFARRHNAGTLAGFLPEVPPFFMHHLGFDLEKLRRAESYADLLAVFAGHPYLPALGANLPPEGTPIDLTALEFSLREAYVRRMQALFAADAPGCADAAKSMAMWVDVQNLQRLLRTKRYFPEQNATVPFLPGGTISKKRLTALEELSFEAAENEVRRTPYGRWFADGLPVDVALKTVLFEQCRKNIRFEVEAPSLLISYLLLSLNRLDCLTTVAEGVRFHMPPEAILNLLPIAKR